MRRNSGNSNESLWYEEWHNTILKNRIKKLEAQFKISNIIQNKVDQYSHHNTVVHDGIPSSGKKRELENKCIVIFGKIDINVH